MSQLSIKVSAKGDALIATLQKEIFNRRRKKVTASQSLKPLLKAEQNLSLINDTRLLGKT